jgi:hypothetical protein
MAGSFCLGLCGRVNAADGPPASFFKSVVPSNADLLVGVADADDLADMECSVRHIRFNGVTSCDDEAMGGAVDVVDDAVNGNGVVVMQQLGIGPAIMILLGVDNLPVGPKQRRSLLSLVSRWRLGSPFGDVFDFSTWRGVKVESFLAVVQHMFSLHKVLLAKWGHEMGPVLQGEQSEQGEFTTKQIATQIVRAMAGQRTGS